MARFENKVLVTGMLAMGVVAGSAVAQQQATNGTDEVKVTVGVKVWYNSWETWVGESGGDGIRSTTSNNTLAAIPNIAVNYKDFFASAGYFVKRTYDFPNHSDFSTFFPFVLEEKMKVKRAEYDVNLGYWLLRGETGGRLGLTVGYKQVNQWFKIDNSISGFPPLPNGNFKDTKKAVTLGFTGSAPLAAGWYLYGNGAFGPAREKYPGEKLKGYYASAEGGVAYPIAPGTTVTLGYKTQVTDFNVKNSSERGRDTTNGFIVGASYTF